MADTDDLVAALSTAVDAWEHALDASEEDHRALEHGASQSVGEARHALETLHAQLGAPHASLDDDVARLRDAVSRLRAEVARARAHVDDVHDRLDREVQAWREQLHEARAATSAAAAHGEHALEELRGAVEQAHHGVDGAMSPLREHLAHQLPDATQSLDARLSAAMDGVEGRANHEWTGALQGAAHGLAATLDRSGHVVQQHARDAHADAHHHADEVARTAESRSHEHLSRAHERATAASGSVQHAAEAAHDVGALLLDGTSALHAASDTVNAPLTTALGILRELEQLFARVP